MGTLKEGLMILEGQFCPSGYLGDKVGGRGGWWQGAVSIN